MKLRRLGRSVVIACLLGSCGLAQTPAHELNLSLDHVGPGWSHVTTVPDGVHGAAAAFRDPGASIDAGVIDVSSERSFTLRAALRTTRGAFSTAVMARDGESVGFSVIIGRHTGRVSFEAWSWRNTKLFSRSRVDDGRWHTIEVSYDSVSNGAVLLIDGVAEACALLGRGGSPHAMLRLGNNIGCDQPYVGDIDEVSLAPGAARADLCALAAPIVSDTAMNAALVRVRHDRQAPRLTPADFVPPAEKATAKREALQDAFGLLPWPHREPLDVYVHGELVVGACRVQRISWQTWASTRATGWLWLPEPAIAGRLPAILNPHGHWAGGAVDPVVTARLRRQAESGYIALAVDSVHLENVAAGVSALGVMTWNNIRAVDVLMERADVDPARIGVTGASGGAQQAMVLMALEPRLAAAAPICMACRYDAIQMDRSTHCMCNHPPRVGGIIDMPEMCALFAPRPVFFGSVTGDWTRNFPTEGWPEIQAVYAALGAPTAASAWQQTAGHNYDRPMREKVYALFDAVLKPPHPVPESDAPAVDPARLRALGLPIAPPDEAALGSEFVTRRGPRRTTRTLAQLAPGLPATESRAAFTPLPAVDATANTSRWYAATVTATDGAPIPLRVRLAAPESRAAAWTLVVGPEASASVAMAPPPWLPATGPVAIAEPRFVGSWAPFAEAWRRNGMFLGRGEGYQMAHDIAVCAASLPGDAPVRVVALGITGVPALMAAQLCARVTTVIADDIGPEFSKKGNRLPLCPELLLYGDLGRLVRDARATCVLTLGGLDERFGSLPTAGPIARPHSSPVAITPTPLDDAAIAAALRDA